jgi:hypothetical protein
MERPTATPNTPGTSATPSVDAIEQRVVAFAEQLGRLVGTVQAKADGWMDRPALQEQVTRIRDGAAGLLRQLGAVQHSKGGKRPAKAGARAKAAKATGAARFTGGRSGGKVDAPGKKHRKPAAPARTVKKSNQMIAKEKASEQMRRGPNKG